jgi:hypothetical protein
MKYGPKVMVADVATHVRSQARLLDETQYELWSIPSFQEQTPERVFGLDIQSGKFLLEPGDVLLGKINPRINRVWVVTAATEPVIQVGSTEWIVLRPRHGTLDSHHLAYCLQSPKFREVFIASVTGATGSHSRGNPEIALNYLIPLPPLDEQKRIVAKLHEGNQKTGSLGNNLGKRLEMAKSLFGLAAVERLLGKKRTVDPGLTQVPEAAEWPLVKLGEICDLYQPETISRKQLKEDGQYVVYGANGPIGRYDRFNHEESEVTIACRGTCGTINVTPPNTWITGNAMVIRPKSEAISKEFLASVLPHLDLSQTISGTAQPQITRKSLSPLLVPVPPMAEQMRIVAELDELGAKIRDLENNLVTQKSLVSAFQSAALSTALAGGV